MAIQNFSSAGSPHEEFTEWAKAQGILINGVAAVRFPGRGIGIAALRDIDVCILPDVSLTQDAFPFMNFQAWVLRVEWEICYATLFGFD